MSATPARISVCEVDRAACIRIDGHARLGSSTDFKHLIQRLDDHSVNRVVLDLEKCTQMDSTFLGTLGRFGIRSRAEPDKLRIELFNPSERVLQIMDNLGVLDYFQVTRGKCDLTGKGEMVLHTSEPASRKEFAEDSLKAHQTLMEIKPANIPKFIDVVTFLRQEVREFETGEASRQKQTQG